MSRLAVLQFVSPGVILAGVSLGHGRVARSVGDHVQPDARSNVSVALRLAHHVHRIDPRRRGICRSPQRVRYRSRRTPISAAAMDGAKGMRVLSSAPPARPAATRVDLTARACKPAQTLSNSEKTKASLTPVHKNATVSSFTSPPPIQPRA